MILVETCTKKVFMSNLQSSNSTSGNSSFYSMQIIPKGKSIFSIFESGIMINLDNTVGKSITNIPLTFQEI